MLHLSKNGFFSNGSSDYPQIEHYLTETAIELLSDETKFENLFSPWTNPYRQFQRQDRKRKSDKIIMSNLNKNCSINDKIPVPKEIFEAKKT